MAEGRDSESWRIDRETFNTSQMSGHLIAGLDLSIKGESKRLDLMTVKNIRANIDADILRKRKQLSKAGDFIGFGTHDAADSSPISIFAGTEELSNVFGPAIGMYFRTVQMFAVTFLLIALVNMPSIMHYARYTHTCTTAYLRSFLLARTLSYTACALAPEHSMRTSSPNAIVTSSQPIPLNFISSISFPQ
jgi:hypothetical protein